MALPMNKLATFRQTEFYQRYRPSIIAALVCFLSMLSIVILFIVMSLTLPSSEVVAPGSAEEKLFFDTVTELVKIHEGTTTSTDVFCDDSGFKNFQNFDKRTGVWDWEILANVEDFVERRPESLRMRRGEHSTRIELCDLKSNTGIALEFSNEKSPCLIDVHYYNYEIGLGRSMNHP